MPGYRRAFRYARRLYPLALAAWRRWERLPDHERERYRALAAEAAARGRAAAGEAVRRGRDLYGRSRGKR